MQPFRDSVKSAAIFSVGVALTAIVFCSGSLMLYSSLHESAIMDELAHIPAGYGYVHALDYRLNPEHPPLVKVLAAAPLLGLDPTFPADDPAWTKNVNDQWAVGGKFLYGGSNNPDTIIRLARIGPILLALLLILLVYRVSRKRLGRLWALLPAFLVAFSPMFLAHGHYVTTDVGASFGILLALWRFVELLESPSRKNLWYAGGALGIAELLKFSAVLLIPAFVFLAALHFWVRRQSSFRAAVRDLVAVFAIGYALIVYPMYAAFTLHYPVAKQVGDTQVILGGPRGGGVLGKLVDLDIGMAGHALTRPAAEYLLGVLMVKQRSDAGNTAYFFGHVSAAGSRWYFPAAYLFKETLPALLIILVAGLFALLKITGDIRRQRFLMHLRSWLRDHFLEGSLFIFVVFYWAYSIDSPLNIGVRHILPTVPLMYILAAGGWRAWTRNDGWKVALLCILLLWSAGEAFAVTPHFLSYYNEFAGGTANGYRFIDDSNYDWGQDLLALRDLLNAHPEITAIAVDYFGGGNAHYYLGDREVDWSSAKGDPRAQGIHWLAVSANPLEEATQPTAPGYERQQEDSYAWLTSARPAEAGMGGVPRPDLRAGTSIFIYHLP